MRITIPEIIIVMEVALVEDEVCRRKSIAGKAKFILKYQRGVIILHVINFLVKLAFYSIFTNITIVSRGYFNLVDLDRFSSILSSIIFGCFLGIGYFLAPVTGFLTDTYFGRYKVLVWSTWGMFIATISYSILVTLVVYTKCISQELLSLSNNNEQDLSCEHGKLVESSVYLFLILISLLVFNAFYSGYHANLCLYGAELLEDADETQKHNYFHIYHFLGVLGAAVAGFTVVPFEYLIFRGSVIVFLFVPPFSLAIILILFRVCKKEFYEHSVRQNPLVLIKQTTVLAVKRANVSKTLFSTKTFKSPTSILDNAKSSQGGRYTSEWVQEVKTFYRLIAIFLSFMWFFAIRATTYSIFIKMGLHMSWPGNTATQINRVVLITFIFQIGNVVALPVIVLLNGVVYKFFRRWYPNMLTSIGIGLLCGLLTLFVAIFIEVGRSEKSNCDVNNVFSKYYGSSVSIFAIIPLYVFLGLGDSFAYATIREFTYAQSPSTMRGLIFGSLQGSRGVGTIISVILILLAQTDPSCSCSDSVTPCAEVIRENPGQSCWYYTNCPGKSGAVYLYLIGTLLTLGFMSLYVFAAVSYRKRLTNFRVDEELTSKNYHVYKLFSKN